MNDFWNNISRYPRFFISSVAGSILIILTPFRNLVKNQKFRVFTFLFIIIFFVTLYFIISSMTGTL